MNLSSLVNEFSEKFTNMHMISLVNTFFKYNQISFYKKNQNIIAIMISFKLL